MGSLLFTTYTRELPLSVIKSMQLHTDNTAVYTIAKDASTAGNNAKCAIDFMSHFLTSKDLILNADKN